MSKQKQVKLELFKIINDSITTEAYTDQQFDTVAEKCQYVLKCFESEYYDLREPNYTKRAAGWLQGLPSVITVPFYNYQIIEIGYYLDLIIPAVRVTTQEARENRFCDQWFELIAHKLIQMSQMKSHAETEFNKYCKGEADQKCDG